jgi:hypothetical protein
MRNLQTYFFSGKTDPVISIVNDFEARVLVDGGNFEAKDYLIEWTRRNFDLYNRASFLLTPNGYKSGTLYAFKGIDLVNFTRTTAGTRILPNFTQEIIAANTPRIDYEFGAPVILSERGGTNSVINSGNSTPPNQTRTVVNNRGYSLGFFGTGTVTLSGAINATFVGTSNTVRTVSTRNQLLSSGTSVDFTFTGDVFWFQFEIGSFTTNTDHSPTSHVPTSGSIVTRNRDNFGNNIVDVSLLNTPYILFTDVIHYSNDGAGTGVIYDLRLDTSNLIRLSTGYTLTRLLGGTLATLTNNASVRTYGKRIRHCLYVDPSTNTVTTRLAQLTSSGWALSTSTSNTVTLPTDLNNLRLFDVDLISVKVKTFAILKDFTGISNIGGFINDLLLRNSI